MFFRHPNSCLRLKTFFKKKTQKGNKEMSFLRKIIPFNLDEMFSTFFALLGGLISFLRSPPTVLRRIGSLHKFLRFG